MGAARRLPAYRGTAYVVFEELPLSSATATACLSSPSRSSARSPSPTRPRGWCASVTLIPASGEFAYATQANPQGLTSGETVAENLQRPRARLHRPLRRPRPAAGDARRRSRASALVVAWFGDDLRAGHLPGPARRSRWRRRRRRPRAWSVNGVERERNAFASSAADDRGPPRFTAARPSDFAVVQAIQELTARGLRVTFYPFILMDVPRGQRPCRTRTRTTPPRPASLTFPWRGRITCSPAAGYRRQRRQVRRRGRKPGRRASSAMRTPVQTSDVDGRVVSSGTGDARRLGPAADDPALRPSLRGRRAASMPS